MKNGKFLAAVMLSGILLIPDSLSQSLKYTSTDDALVVVKGTSTLHDWELKSETVMSEVTFITGNGGAFEALDSVIFVLKKTSLKSDRSRLERMSHEELGADDNPQITFRSDGNSEIERNGNEYGITANGDLTISGVTRQISVVVTCKNTGDEMVCTGTKDLKMTDYDIDPPTLLLGTIQTHDDVTVEFRIVYSQ